MPIPPALRYVRTANWCRLHSVPRAMPPFAAFDLVALAGFVGALAAYAFTVDRPSHGGASLSVCIVRYRGPAMRSMLTRIMRLVVSPLQLRRDPARRDAPRGRNRYAGSGCARAANGAAVLLRRPSFQSRAAGVFLRARLSWVVCRADRADRHHGSDRSGDVAAAIRLGFAARDRRRR